MNEAKFSIKCKLTEMAKLLHRGEGDDEIRIQRASLLKDHNDITSNEALDLSQKAKIRWSIKGKDIVAAVTEFFSTGKLPPGWIGVSKAETNLATSVVGCSTFSPPFYYLKVKIRASMSRITSWKEVTDKISSPLSKWKIKTLSSGGRLALLKSVLTALLLYYMSI
nr:hypothetical protein [Tanacetum cinerariifolium]